MSLYAYLRNRGTQFRQIPRQPLADFLLHRLKSKIEAIRRELQFDILSDLSRIGDHSRQCEQFVQTFFRPEVRIYVSNRCHAHAHFSNELKEYYAGWRGRAREKSVTQLSVTIAAFVSQCGPCRKCGLMQFPGQISIHAEIGGCLHRF
ncbi:hypothetical protein RHECNPAF_430052 [Rhizobium etli CNPAF512]|nr:hypothetical protein RHECNPAF_430052 [Rhizobium etli CNPAF512]